MLMGSWLHWDSLTSDVIVVLGWQPHHRRVPSKLLFCAHYVESAVATVALVKRKTSASKNTKPGKAPKVSFLPKIHKPKTKKPRRSSVFGLDWGFLFQG